MADVCYCSCGVWPLGGAQLQWQLPPCLATPLHWTSKHANKQINNANKQTKMSEQKKREGGRSIDVDGRVSRVQSTHKKIFLWKSKALLTFFFLTLSSLSLSLIWNASSAWTFFVHPHSLSYRTHNPNSTASTHFQHTRFFPSVHSHSLFQLSNGGNNLPPSPSRELLLTDQMCTTIATSDTHTPPPGSSISHQHPLYRAPQKNNKRRQDNHQKWSAQHSNVQWHGKVRHCTRSLFEDVLISMWTILLCLYVEKKTKEEYRGRGHTDDK